MDKVNLFMFSRLLMGKIFWMREQILNSAIWKRQVFFLLNSLCRKAQGWYFVGHKEVLVSWLVKAMWFTFVLLCRRILFSYDDICKTKFMLKSWVVVNYGYNAQKPESWRLACQTIVGNKENSGKVKIYFASLCI